MNTQTKEAMTLRVDFCAVHIYRGGKYLRTVEGQFTEGIGRAYAESFNARVVDERAVLQIHSALVQVPRKIKLKGGDA